MNQRTKQLSWKALGPGILVAATGVGAGDLATATFSGASLGTAVLWAVLVGAALKYLLNEGLTRWQLATGTSVLEGTVNHLGRLMQWIFMIYLIVWSYLVAMALMSACGVTAHAIFPIFEDASTGKILFGIVQSVLAAALVLIGGYGLFEKVMGACIGIMFTVACATAIVLRPSLGDVVSGLLIPVIPNLRGGGLSWTIALLGGVGGTVTILCYGYWIREEGRTSIEDLRLCRFDLAVGYGMTAFFGLAMVIIGSQLGKLDGSGASLIVNVADTLQDKLGNLGVYAKWAFLIGAWGAVFSSLLGVWQSVPYLFTDFWFLLRPMSGGTGRINSSSKLYRLHLAAIALIPISGLFLFNFQSAMKIYGIAGAMFIPMLAIVLLILNGNSQLVGRSNRNSAVTTGLLSICLTFFVLVFLIQLGQIVGVDIIQIWLG